MSIKHPNGQLTQSALAVAFFLIVVAGVLGGFIGTGAGAGKCGIDCPELVVLGSFIGALFTSCGAGIVVVVTMRATTLWQKHPPAK